MRAFEVSIICLLVLVEVKASLVNIEARRTIDLTSQLVTVSIRQTVKNTGSDIVNAVGFLHDAKLEEHLSFISVKV